MAYFEKKDILHLMVAPGPEVQSIELSPDTTVEMDAQGQILGIEILNASKFMAQILIRMSCMARTCRPRWKPSWQ